VLVAPQLLLGCQEFAECNLGLGEFALASKTPGAEFERLDHDFRVILAQNLFPDSQRFTLHSLRFGGSVGKRHRYQAQLSK